MDMEIGIDSFAAKTRGLNGQAALSDADRMAFLLEEVEAADRAGLDVFGIGEHHRSEYIDSAPAVILAAAAARTKSIRLTSAVTVLSAADPVRVFQEFATVDLISRGRAEIVVGRGSSIEAYPLFGFDLNDYDELFVEKLDLLLALRDETSVTWSGRFRPALSGQGVYPRPKQAELPIWLGVGGTPISFARAGTLGLPLMVAIIGGEIRRFRPLIDLYREAGRRAGHPPERLKVGLHVIGFVGHTTKDAAEAFYPGWLEMFGKVGRERGWPTPTRTQFDELISPRGAYLVGDPNSVVAKIRSAADDLDGIDRLTFQMSTAAGDPKAMLRSIELLGREVRPRIGDGSTRNFVDQTS
jgi:probable LLM family oxidoreductase